MVAPFPSAATPQHKASAKQAKGSKSSPAGSSSTPSASRTKATVTPSMSTPSSAKGKKRRESKTLAGTPVQPISNGLNGKVAASPAVAVGQDAAEIESAHPEWDFEVVAGSAVPRQAPVFTKDFNHFILPHPTQIRLHSASNLTPLSTITSPRLPSHHSAAITAVLLNPLNALQLITASLDGTIKIWDYLDGTCLRTIACPGPVEQLVVGDKGDAKGRWWISVRGEGKDKRKRRKDGEKNIKGHQGPQSTIYELNMPSTSTASSSSSVPRPHQRIARIRHCTTLLLSPSGSFLVALAGQKAYVLPTAKDRMQEGFTKFVSPEVLTCGAMHPKEDWFVSGDEKGVVRMWFCLGELASSRAGRKEESDTLVEDVADNDDAASDSGAASTQQKSSAAAGIRTTPTTTFHWHSHAVSSIAFTAAGTSILSGGEEGVLVSWSVANGNKTFVPRVGGPIGAVVVRPPAEGREEEWWVGLTNGSLRRLGGDGKGGRNVLGGWESAKIEPSPSPSANRPTPLAYHPQTNSLLLPSAHPSSVQLYSPAHQSSILELEVAPSNRVSRSADKEVEPIRVEHAALGHGGEDAWLATGEKKEEDEEEGAAEARSIKVWRWDAQLKTYILTTRLDGPHKTDLTSMSFSPVPVSLPAAAQPALLLLSTSQDGVARLWREKRTRYKSGKVEASFQPLSLLSHRGQAIHSSSWSPDASVLALAQGSLVTIWDPATSVLRGSLSSPDVPSIHKVAFAGIGGRYVVGTGARKGVAVWDLLGGEVVWSSSTLATDFLNVGESLTTFTTAVVSSLTNAPSTTFTVHSLTSAAPLRVRQIPKRIRSLASFPRSAASEDETSVLAVIDNWDVLVVGDAVHSAFDSLSSLESTQAVDLSSGAASAGPSLFDEIFGAQAGPSSTPSFAAVDAKAEAAKKAATAPKKWTSLEEIFDGSAQVLPAMSMVFDEVLEHVLSRRTGDADDEELEDEEGGGGMDVDEPVGEDSPTRREWQPREVVEQDVVELADFFKDMLGSPAPPSSLPPKTIALRLANGSSSATSTPNGKPTRAAALRSAGSTPVAAGGSTFESDSPQGSGKKRKSKEQ